MGTEAIASLKDNSGAVEVSPGERRGKGQGDMHGRDEISIGVDIGDFVTVAVEIIGIEIGELVRTND